MNNPSAGIIILITLVAVVIINVAIIFAVKNRKPNQSSNLKVFGDLTKQLRNPFQKEETNLKNLSNLVEKIQEEMNSENNLEQ